jgi:hypothetical protein
LSYAITSEGHLKYILKNNIDISNYDIDLSIFKMSNLKIIMIFGIFIVVLYFLVILEKKFNILIIRFQLAEENSVLLFIFLCLYYLQLRFNYFPLQLRLNFLIKFLIFEIKNYNKVVL